jgi:hypothetical protein
MLAATLLVALLLAIVGRHPMWGHRELNLSEAAASRDEAEVVRLIGYGQDPNLQWEVRPGILSRESLRVTPLEAAVGARDPHMVARLFANGAVLTPHVWSRLRCAAEGEGLPEVLDAHRPEGVVLECGGPDRR